MTTRNRAERRIQQRHARSVRRIEERAEARERARDKRGLKGTRLWFAKHGRLART